MDKLHAALFGAVDRIEEETGRDIGVIIEADRPELFRLHFVGEDGDDEFAPLCVAPGDLIGTIHEATHDYIERLARGGLR